MNFSGSSITQYQYLEKLTQKWEKKEWLTVNKSQPANFMGQCISRPSPLKEKERKENVFQYLTSKLF
jgi:hypothetical protein